MRAFAFCALSLKRSAAAVAGVTPLTSPPVSLVGDRFDPAWLSGADFVFFKLHGQEGLPVWYGDGALPAVTADQLAQADLDGALVFAANCWGGRESPMITALLSAGAAAVVTGEGLNWAGTTRVDGIDVMALCWRYALSAGLAAGSALTLAKTLALARRPGLLSDIQSFTLVGRPAARLRKMEMTL